MKTIKLLGDLLDAMVGAILSIIISPYVLVLLTLGLIYIAR